MNDTTMSSGRWFGGYSDEDRERICRAICLPGHVMSQQETKELFFHLEDGAAHYQDLRCAYDLHHQMKGNLRKNDRLRSAAEELLAHEKLLPAPRPDMVHWLQRKLDELVCERRTLAPFSRWEGSYIWETMQLGLGKPSSKLRSYPEHVFVGWLLHAFGRHRGLSIDEVPVGNDEGNDFVRFAMACLAPVDRRRFTVTSVRDAARKVKARQLDFAPL